MQVRRVAPDRPVPSLMHRRRVMADRITYVGLMFTRKGSWSRWRRAVCEVRSGSTAGSRIRRRRWTDCCASSAATAQQLQAKAPDLWNLAHADHVTFTHVQQDGAQFLDELRRAYSRSFLRKVIRAGVGVFEAETGMACVPQWLEVPDHGSQVLYDLRRDAEGVPHTLPARQKSPSPYRLP
jgi:hypothetical protein